MTMRICAVLLGTAILAAGCKEKTDDNGTTTPPAKTAAPSSTPTPRPSAPPPTVTPSAPAAEPKPAAPEVGYALSAIKTIPDNCSTPAVVLATAPKSVGSAYEWNITRQALLANQQFRVVSHAPSSVGEVQIAPYEFNNTAYALVARCKDGGTCNQLAAMYKAIVRTSNPQLSCGKVAGIGSAQSGTFSWQASPQGNLPSPGDNVSACARLDACMIATDRSTPGDPFVECQKAPHSFQTSCARRYPCAEVMACIKK